MSIEHRDIIYGNKTMSLNINWPEQRASMRFGSRSSGRRHHKKGETTEIFRQAEEVIRQLIDEKRIPIHLQFDTANTNLKLWAEANKNLLGLVIEHDGSFGYRITVSKDYEV